MRELPITLLIKIASKRNEKFLDAMFLEKNIGAISIPERQILHALYEGRLIKACQFMEENHMAKSTFSEAVSSLTERGYILYVTSESDRREKEIIITEEGRKHCQVVSEALSDFNAKCAAGIPEEDLETAKEVLKKIIENTKGGDNGN